MTNAEMGERMTPERLREIADWFAVGVNKQGQGAECVQEIRASWAECERLRADILEAVKDHCDLSEFVEPLKPLESLCVQIESERACKESWRQRAERAEAELADAKESANRCDKQAQEYFGLFQKAEAELAEARKDTERLQYLIEKEYYVVDKFRSLATSEESSRYAVTDRGGRYGGRYVATGPTPRAAIDAARGAKP